MKISIVVPVYNAEKYLQECIQSVLNQTNSNWELVLVDDGSIDKSAEICDAFAEEYPDKILSFHKQNEGQFLTRQYGIEKCSGGYIGFLDADDLLSKEYVKTIVNFVEEYGSKEIICFGFSRFEDDIFTDKKQLQNTNFETKEELKELHLRIVDGKVTGSMWSKVFKNELIKSVEINDEIVSQKKYGEDAFQSFAIMLKANNITFLDAPLYYYRDNPQGASVGYSERGFDYFNTKYVFELIETFLLKNYPSDDYLFKKLYAHNFNSTVDHILKFYRNTKSFGRKKQIVKYDWTSYLLDETPKYIDNNEYVRKSYIKVWKAFCDKNHAEIYIRERFKRFIGW